jgi:hypothetical protein
MAALNGLLETGIVPDRQATFKRRLKRFGV